MKNDKVKQELESAKQELKVCYLSISDYYKRLSKTHDTYSYTVIQSGIDHQLAKAAELRTKVEALLKESINSWKEGTPDVLFNQ